MVLRFDRVAPDLRESDGVHAGSLPDVETRPADTEEREQDGQRPGQGEARPVNGSMPSAPPAVTRALMRSIGLDGREVRLPPWRGTRP